MLARGSHRCPEAVPGGMATARGAASLSQLYQCCSRCDSSSCFPAPLLYPTEGQLSEAHTSIHREAWVTLTWSWQIWLNKRTYAVYCQTGDRRSIMLMSNHLGPKHRNCPWGLVFQISQFTSLPHPAWKVNWHLHEYLHLLIALLFSFYIHKAQSKMSWM